MKLFGFLKGEKEKINVTVIDNNKELPDFRKISIPDLKQYLVDGYEEIRQVRDEKDKLDKELESALQYKELYEATLVTLDEFKKRDSENKSKIDAMSKRHKEGREKYDDLREELNNYKIMSRDLTEREKQVEKEIRKAEKNAKMLYKRKIIKEISEFKGNISKSKILNLIEGVEE